MAQEKPKDKANYNDWTESLPDFDVINNTLKATWIRRLDSGYPTASWTHIPVTLWPISP